MSLLILFLALTTAVVVVLIRMVSHDGYGTTPAPRSHRPDTFEPFAGRRIV